MNKLVVMLGGAAMAIAGSYAANATTFDGSVAAPGEYYGIGNTGLNFNWTIDTGSGIEVAQKAIERFIGDVDPVAGTNIYNVPTGDTTVPTKTGTNWGFVFSVNGGATTLANMIPVLTLFDVANNTHGGFDLRLLPDNGNILPPPPPGGSVVADCSKVPAGTCTSADTGLQNSEALTFASIAAGLGDVGYSDAINDTYFLTLSVYSPGSGSCGRNAGTGCGTLLASNVIQINQGLGATAVPEPGTLALFGAGLAGLGVARRRRKSRAV